MGKANTTLMQPLYLDEEPTYDRVLDQPVYAEANGYGIVVFDFFKHLIHDIAVFGKKVKNDRLANLLFEAYYSMNLQHQVTTFLSRKALGTGLFSFLLL